MQPDSDSSILGRIGKPIKNVHPFLREFREFAMRGNVIDLAVGVIIGAAFGKIVDSLVTNIIMAPLGALTGGIDLSQRYWVLARTHPDYATFEDAKKAGAAVIAYGVFLNAIINFLIVSFTIFVCVRIINKIAHKPAPPPPDKKDCPFCCSAIPIQATRCPQCTSTLAPVAAKT